MPINNYFLNSPSLISEDGTVLSNEGPKVINDLELNNVYLTNFSTTSFYLGLDIKRITNTSYEMYDGLNIRKDLWNIYADFFLSSSINMENMLVTDTVNGGSQSYNVLHDNTGGFKFRKTGFRVGFEMTRYLTNHSGLTFQVEGGVRPGIENVNNTDYIFGNRNFAICRLLYTFGMPINFNKES